MTVIQTTGSSPISVVGSWGPQLPNGSNHIYLDFNQAVSGVAIEVIRLVHNGRTVSLRDSALTNVDGARYRLTLPRRFQSQAGSYQIMLTAEYIRSITDPDSTLHPDDSTVDLPDAGLST